MSFSLSVRPSATGRSTITFPQISNIIGDFDALSNAIAQRAFGFFQQRGGENGFDLDDWFRAESELLKPVPIEMSETTDSYTIHAEVPGFDAKDLTIQAEPNCICIHGKKDQKKEEKTGEEVTYSEVTANELYRRIDMPSSINSDKVSAHLVNGVLEVTIPKAAPPKTIEVKAA